MGEAQQKTEPKSSLHAYRSMLTFAATAGTIIAAINLNWGLIKPWREHRYVHSLAVQDSNLPAEEVDEYLKRDVFWKWISILATKDVNVPKLDILLGDPEIISEVKDYYGDRSTIGVILSVVDADPNTNPPFIWNEYCQWRSKGGGALGLQVAKRCGWNLESLLGLPNVPDEKILLAFEENKVSDKYFLPLLVNDVNLLYIMELHKAMVPTEYSLPFIQEKRWVYDIIFLWGRRIPIEYALPLKELSPSEIADKYSMETLGMPDKVRNAYMAINPRYMNDDRIKKWRKRGMTFDDLKAIAKEGAGYVESAFDLAERNMLKRGTYDEWVPEIGIVDTLFGLANGYTKKQASDIKNRYETSLQQFDKEMKKYRFMKGFVEKELQQRQQILNGAPK